MVKSEQNRKAKRKVHDSTHASKTSPRRSEYMKARVTL